jgi:hypothetical protein
MRRMAVLIAAVVMLTAVAQAVVQTNIYNIQTGAHPAGTIVNVGTLTNVVVTASGRFGFCIQEVTGLAPGAYPDAYCGIWVYTGGSHVGLLQKGSKVSVTARYDEYYSLSELNVGDIGTEGSFQVLGTATMRPPVYVGISDINGGALSEAFESVIVKVCVGDVDLFARQPSQYSEWYLSTKETPGEGDSILIDSFSADPSPNGDFDYTVPVAGQLFTYVQGMLTYSYGNWLIAPRNCPIDLGTACAPGLRGAWAVDNTHVDVLFAVDVDPVTAGMPINYYFETPLATVAAARDASNFRLVHLTTSAQTSGVGDVLYVEGVESIDGTPVPANAQSSFTQGITSIYQIQHVANVLADASPYVNKVVTTTGRVTAVDGNVYYLQQGDAGPFKHLQGRVAPYGTLSVGDSIKFAGVVVEYNGSTELSFKSGIQYWENLGPATRPVITTNVAANQIIYDAYPLATELWRPGNNLPEPWEDALLHLTQPVTVDSVDAEAKLFGEYWLLAGTDSCRTDINHSLNDYGATLSPRGLWVGDILDMRGILRYEYTFYRLVPRQQSDIVIVHSNMAVDTPAPGSVISLSQNQPNPFADATAFRFRLEDNANEVSAEVFDVTGACVRHLLNREPARAGEHIVQWDRTTDRGERVAAGTYFYRLTVDGRSEARQMVTID